MQKLPASLLKRGLMAAAAMTAADDAITPLDAEAVKFNLERNKVDNLPMNWTVVHPIDAESPLSGFSEEDLRAADTSSPKVSIE